MPHGDAACEESHDAGEPQPLARREDKKGKAENEGELERRLRPDGAAEHREAAGEVGGGEGDDEAGEAGADEHECEALEESGDGEVGDDIGVGDVT